MLIPKCNKIRKYQLGQQGINKVDVFTKAVTVLIVVWDFNLPGHKYIFLHNRKEDHFLEKLRQHAFNSSY